MNNTVQTTTLSGDFAKALSRLEPTAHEVLVRYFGLDKHPRVSLGEIARQMGITKAQVGQIKDKAVAELKNDPVVANEAANYLREESA